MVSNLNKFCLAAMVAYKNSRLKMGDPRPPYIAGRMLARDVLVARGHFDGICHAADALGLCATRSQFAGWVSEAYDANDLNASAVRLYEQHIVLSL